MLPLEDKNSTVRVVGELLIPEGWRGVDLSFDRRSHQKPKDKGIASDVESDEDDPKASLRDTT